MVEFYNRLRQERKRLGLSQEKFATLGGVTRDTQMNYESGSRKPDSDYMIALAIVGVDVLYLLTGEYGLSTLSADEKKLLSGYRGLDIRGKAGVLGMIDGMNIAPTRGSTTHVELHGSVGQQVTGDIKSPQTFTIGGSKKKKPPVSD